MRCRTKVCVVCVCASNAIMRRVDSHRFSFAYSQWIWISLCSRRVSARRSILHRNIPIICSCTGFIWQWAAFFRSNLQLCHSLPLPFSLNRSAQLSLRDTVSLGHCLRLNAMQSAVKHAFAMRFSCIGSIQPAVNFLLMSFSRAVLSIDLDVFLLHSSSAPPSFYFRLLYAIFRFFLTNLSYPENDVELRHKRPAWAHKFFEMLAWITGKKRLIAAAEIYRKMSPRKMYTHFGPYHYLSSHKIVDVSMKSGRKPAANG